MREWWSVYPYTIIIIAIVYLVVHISYAAGLRVRESHSIDPLENPLSATRAFQFTVAQKDDDNH